jgi:hypothetical protein
VEVLAQPTIELIEGMRGEQEHRPHGDHRVGRDRFDLKGALAGILRLTADGKEPAAIGDGLEQIKVVAGIYLLLIAIDLPLAGAGVQRQRALRPAIDN